MINLVTGGAGFIGSHLIDSLLKKNEEIICIDNLLTGNRENLDKWGGDKNFTYLNHDIVNPIDLKVNKIWHLACPASPIHYQNDPVQTIKTCVHGAINMLGLAKRTKAKIIQASTSEIYGDPEIHPQTEEYKGAVSINGPRACYDEGKRCAETLFWDYKRQHNVDVKVVRIFNTYGPRMQKNDGRVVSNFIVQALSNKNITVYGDGKQTRSFCYVDDLVEGILLAMEKKNFPGPVNLGNPIEISIMQLAKEITEMIGSKSKVINKELPVDDPKQRCPDIELAKKKLGWNPKFKREEGLKKTIDYFEKLLEEER